MGELQELIDRLEKASGPDPYLDEDIREFFWKPSIDVALAPYNYTASLDAAVGLGERMWPGGDWKVSLAGWKRNWAIVEGKHGAEGTGATPAIALCVATLKAVSRSLPRPGDAT